MKSISGKDINQVTRSALKQMEIALPMSPDIYCLPEAFHVAGLKGDKPPLRVSSEDGGGNIIDPFQTFAQKNQCYIICPIFTREKSSYYNAAAIIDRQGNYLDEYRKVRLTEGELRKGLTPGPIDVPVFDLDFGKIGVQICFDLEWPEGWNQLKEKGAEIVFFLLLFQEVKELMLKHWKIDIVWFLV